MDPQARDALALLTVLGETVATAESLTGGCLGAALSAVPGASAAYRGGVIAYASDVKAGVLGVAEDLIDEYGVVSAECAEAMALGVRSLTASSYSLSTTGVAGPDPQDGQPVGTVFVGLATPTGTTVTRLELRGSREAIRTATCSAALDLLVQRLRHDSSTDHGRPAREETPLG